MDNAPFYISLGHRTAAVAPTLAHNTGLTVIIGGLFSIIILGLWWLTRRWHPKHLQAPWWVALLVALMLGLLAGTLLGVRAAASGPVTAYSLGGTWHLHFPLDNHRYFVAITADHNGSLSGGNGGGGHYQQDWDTGYPDTDTIEALVSDGAFDDNQLDGTCSSPAYPATGNAASDFSCALAYANTKGISFDLLTAVGGSSTATSSTTRLVTIPHITVSQSSRVFTIQLSYHEAMNPAVAPIISYGADLSSALTFNSGVWTADNTIYLATSTITGVRNITGIVATVSGGQAQADGAAPATTAGAPFNIDTRLPIITLWGPATMTIAHHATLFDPLAGAVSGSGATLTVSASGAVDTSTVGAYSVVYTIADAYGNTASTTRTMQVADTTAGQMALQTNTALTSTVSQAIVTPNNIAPAIITIASDAVSPSLNVASVMSGTAAVMPGSITAQATLSGNNVTAFIPAGAHISTADASAWDSIINLPQQGDSSLAPSSGGGTTYAMSSAVEFGHGTLALVSTLPVSLRFAGQAGRFAAWSHGGSFHPITITCNDATNPTNLSADGNCVISVAGDLVVWTKHLSTFFTYTQGATPVASGGGVAPPPPGAATLSISPATTTTTSATSTVRATTTPESTLKITPAAPLAVAPTTTASSSIVSIIIVPTIKAVTIFAQALFSPLRHILLALGFITVDAPGWVQWLASALSGILFFTFLWILIKWQRVGGWLDHHWRLLRERMGKGR